MSETVENPYADWWKQFQSPIRTKKTARGGRAPLAKIGDSILIVTEGEVTEPVYFKLLRKELGLSAVRVVITPGQHSDPRHVIKTAEAFVKDLAKRARKNRLGMDELPKYDHVWAVVDTDVAVREGFWNDVEQLAVAKGVTLAQSTPCIEYWLLLHLKQGPTTRGDLVNGKKAKAVVREALGCDYSTNEEVAKEVMPVFLTNWREAVKMAEQVRRYHVAACTRPPANPSTDVDILVNTMSDAARKA